MGSIFSAPKIQAPPPPPEPKDYNVEDQITGTKQTVVTGADGTKTVVISKNLNAEQQAIEDNLKRLAEDSLAKYESLINDPFLDTMPDYKAQIDNIFKTQNKNLTDAFQQTTREAETALSRFGVDDSTASTQFRAENIRNVAGARQQLADDQLNTINAVRQQEMQNQLGLYGLASGRQDTLLAQGMNTLKLGSSIGLANAARNDTYQQNLYNNSLSIALANQKAQSQGLGTLGQLAGIGLGLATGGRTGFAATGLRGLGSNQSYYPSTGIINWAR